MSRAIKLLLIGLTGLALVACSTVDKESGTGDDGADREGDNGAQTGGVEERDGMSERSGVDSEDGVVEGDAGAGETGAMMPDERLVYFAFDSSNIDAEYTEILQAHGEYLANNPQASVVVEGHTDERGTREYNLALGERRAQAVAQVLSLNGAADSQLETVSFGEEQPAVNGDSEEAMSQNRRAELVYRR